MVAVVVGLSARSAGVRLEDLVAGPIDVGSFGPGRRSHDQRRERGWPDHVGNAHTGIRHDDDGFTSGAQATVLTRPTAKSVALVYHRGVEIAARRGCRNWLHPPIEASHHCSRQASTAPLSGWVRCRRPGR